MSEEKMITLPTRYYCAAAQAASLVLAQLDEDAEAGKQLGIMAQALREELTRWALWHDAAEERGLTRWE